MRDDRPPKLRADPDDPEGRAQLAGIRLVSAVLLAILLLSLVALVGPPETPAESATTAGSAVAVNGDRSAFPIPAAKAAEVLLYDVELRHASCDQMRSAVADYTAADAEDVDRWTTRYLAEASSSYQRDVTVYCVHGDGLLAAVVFRVRSLAGDADGPPLPASALMTRAVSSLADRFGPPAELGPGVVPEEQLARWELAGNPDLRVYAHYRPSEETVWLRYIVVPVNRRMLDEIKESS